MRPARRGPLGLLDQLRAMAVVIRRQELGPFGHWRPLVVVRWQARAEHSEERQEADSGSRAKGAGEWHL